MLRMFVILFSLSMLVACSPVRVNPSNQYLIKRIPCYVPTKRMRPIVLLISKPETRAIYNTTQMAYSLRPYQISYYGLNQWAAAPDEMLQPLLVQTMQNTHHFKAVVTPPYTGRYDYELNTEILELLQDYTCRAPVFRMTVRAQIIKTATNRVIATREFSVGQPMLQCSPYGGVYAANAATVEILQRIAMFGLEKM